MFEQRAAMFLYCVSPVHMGAGTALGAIDNPIQRERHSGHPNMAGSGIKGAMRHEASVLWRDRRTATDRPLLEAVFGPETTSSSEYAGALSVSDAQLVLFPVRSLRRSYVYATCPTALARLQRLLVLAGIQAAQQWDVPTVSDDGCVVLNENGLLTGAQNHRHLILETFQFVPQSNGAARLRPIALWLSQHALAGDAAHAYFRNKIVNDTVLLSDERFGHFVQSATVVEPHVRINDETGTADEGGLFYTENLPPESLLVSLVMASRERERRGQTGMSAEDVLGVVTASSQPPDGQPAGFHERLIQLGGDATAGRGQVVLRFVR